MTLSGSPHCTSARQSVGRYNIEKRRIIEGDGTGGILTGTAIESNGHNPNDNYITIIMIMLMTLL